MSMWEELLGAAKDVAPALAGAAGTALGGPVGGAIAASIARKLTGSANDRPLDEVAADIMADPDKLLEFRRQMREAENRELEIRTRDVQDARATLQRSKGAIAVSALVTAAFAVAVFLVVGVEIPTGSQSVAYVMFGSLAAAFSQVLNFWLGSSMGSKEKDQMLARFSEAARADQAARAEHTARRRSSG